MMRMLILFFDCCERYINAAVIPTDDIVWKENNATARGDGCSFVRNFLECKLSARTYFIQTRFKTREHMQLVQCTYN